MNTKVLKERLEEKFSERGLIVEDKDDNYLAIEWNGMSVLYPKNSLNEQIYQDIEKEWKDRIICKNVVDKKVLEKLYIEHGWENIPTDTIVNEICENELIPYIEKIKNQSNVLVDFCYDYEEEIDEENYLLNEFCKFLDSHNYKFYKVNNYKFKYRGQWYMTKRCSIRKEYKLILDNNTLYLQEDNIDNLRDYFNKFLEDGGVTKNNTIFIYRVWFESGFKHPSGHLTLFFDYTWI